MTPELKKFFKDCEARIPKMEEEGKCSRITIDLDEDFLASLAKVSKKADVTLEALIVGSIELMVKDEPFLKKLRKARDEKDNEQKP